MRTGSVPIAPNTETLPTKRSRRWRLNKPFFLLVLTGVPLASWWVQAQSGIRVGYVNITAAPGENAVAGSALFSFSNGDGVLVSEAAVPASRTISDGRALVDEKDTRTAVAMANAGPEPATVNLSLHDRRGAQLGTRSVSLGAGEQRSSFVAELFGELPANFLGSLAFASDRPLGVLTLREATNGFGEPLYSTVPVIEESQAPSTTPLIVPHLAAGRGYVTRLLLAGAGVDAARGSIRLVSPDGRPLLLQVDGEARTDWDFEIPPRGAYRVELTNESDLAVGYAVITPRGGDPAPAGAALLQLRDGQGLVTEAGVEVTNAGSAARVFVDTVGTRTGMAIANSSNVAAEVDLTLVDRFGFQQAESQRTLLAGGHLAVFVDELFGPLAPGFTGTIDLRSETPVAVTSLKLTLNARAQQVLTTLPVVRPGSLATATLFPQVVLGGGFSTRLILINGETGLSAAGTIAFRLFDGQPMPVSLGGITTSEFDYVVASGGSGGLFPGNTARVARVALLDDADFRETAEIVVNEGSRVRPKLLVNDETGRPRDDFSLTFDSLSSDVASVDETGLIQGHRPGFSSLTVRAGTALAAATITVVSIESGVGGFEVTGVAQDSGRRLYLASPREHVVNIANDIRAVPRVFAGITALPGFRDDARLNAQFSEPSFLAIDHSDGSIYVSDTANHRIRRIDAAQTGRVETVAGSGTAGSVDGEALGASFDQPRGIALDHRGHLWVADSASHSIRRVDLITGAVETIAGRPGVAGSVDGLADEATFNTPTGLALEPETAAQQLARELSGEPPPPIRIIVADTGNGLLRRISEDGRVETLRSGESTTESLSAGVPESVGRAEVPVVPLSFDAPEAIVVDPFGNIHVSEPGSGRVRTVLSNGQVVTTVESGTFDAPHGLAINSTGGLIVSDENRGAAEVRFGRPEIIAIDPPGAGTAGGSAVVIEGRNFAPDSIVIIAGSVATAIVVDSETISLTTPVLPSGRTTLTVQNRAGLTQAAFLVSPQSLDSLPSGHITTLAGGATFTGDGGDAAGAVLAGPEQVVVDSAGNVLVADTGNHRIRKVDALTGLITTVAGNGRFGLTGDGGPAVAASFTFPAGVAIDAAGNILVADTGNSRIRRIDADTATITILAGSRTGFSGDGGPAVEASLNAPRAVAIDPELKVWVADSSNHRIRRIDTDGTIATVAGNGSAGFGGDGVPATDTSLNSPRGLSFDASGRLIIADTFNHRVRMIDEDGVIRTVIGGGEGGLSFPRAVVVDERGRMLIADSGGHRIVRSEPSGKITVLIGTGLPGFAGDGSLAREARVFSPAGVAVDGGGNILVADTGNHRVRRVAIEELRPSPFGLSPGPRIVRTLAGTGMPGFLGDGGPATAGNMRSPSGVATDRNGNMFISDSANHRIRRIDGASKIITTFGGTGVGGFSGDNVPATEAMLNFPQGIALDAAGNIFIADNLNHRVRRIDARGTVTTVAGSGQQGFSGDGGPATEALLAFPSDVAVDDRGFLFIADTASHRIRRVELATGTIVTVAGNGRPRISGDGGPATAASLNSPRAVRLDGEGNLFVADSGNDRIRRIDTRTGFVTTVAGSGERGFGGDGGAAVAAALNFPLGVAINSAGEVFVSDSFNNRVRRVSPISGLIQTVAGTGSEGFSGDGGRAADAMIHVPAAAVIDASGNLIFVDNANDRVRAIRAPGGP